mmetsp:Transcript_22829/g.70946  ORF Transcript_22829/g.70946 Transcript_22829/m.70946 type:complete len:270 (+) Transcript_22829:1866-2675(+)
MASRARTSSTMIGLSSSVHPRAAPGACVAGSTNPACCSAAHRSPSASSRVAGSMSGEIICEGRHLKSLGASGSAPFSRSQRIELGHPAHAAMWRAVEPSGPTAPSWQPLRSRRLRISVCWLSVAASRGVMFFPRGASLTSLPQAMSCSARASLPMAQASIRGEWMAPREEELPASSPALASPTPWPTSFPSGVAALALWAGGGPGGGGTLACRCKRARWCSRQGGGSCRRSHSGSKGGVQAIILPAARATIAVIDVRNDGIPLLVVRPP